MEIGNILREAREAKRLSFDMVEQKTNIRKKYLQALEDESFDIMPGRVYAKGFLRNYACFLGLDPIPLLSAFDEKNPVPEVEVIEAPKTYINLESKRRPGFWVLGFIAVALIAFFAYNPSVNIVDYPSKAPDISQQGNNQGNSGQPAPGNSDVEPIDSTPQEEQGIRIVLDVVEQTSWMSVEVDGVHAFQGILSAGETKEFKGNKKINVRLGNPGVVEVELNGAPIGVLGQTGQPISKEFTIPHG